MSDTRRRLPGPDTSTLNGYITLHLLGLTVTNDFIMSPPIPVVTYESYTYPPTTDQPPFVPCLWLTVVYWIHLSGCGHVHFVKSLSSTKSFLSLHVLIWISKSNSLARVVSKSDSWNKRRKT